VLAGDGAFGSLEIRFELAPQSGRRPRFVGLGLPFFLWLGVSAALEFGSGLVGGGPDVAGAGGPSFISDAAGFEPLPFGGQLPGEGFGVGRAGFVMLHLGVGGLPQGVCFGRRGDPQGAAHIRRGAGLGAFPGEDLGFQLTAVQAAHDLGFVAVSSAVNTAIRMFSSSGLPRCGSRETAWSGLVIPAASR
jgi:hypothetical protein